MSHMSHMSHQNFRTYDLAVQLYRRAKLMPLKGDLKDQLLRASSSVALNLSEGSARNTRKDRLRFYTMAFASCREIQAILDLEDCISELRQPADVLAAHLYKLVHS